MEIFKEAGFIEKYGSGIKRVRNTFTEYGLPEPRFKPIGNDLLVIAYGKNVTENVTEKRHQVV